MFVMAVLRTQRAGCRRDGNSVTISPVGMLNQQVAYGEMLEEYASADTDAKICAASSLRRENDERISMRGRRLGRR